MLRDDLNEAIHRRRFSLIVLDEEAPDQLHVERWLAETIRSDYEPFATMFSGAESTLGWSKTGHRVRPNFVYRARVESASDSLARSR